MCILKLIPFCDRIVNITSIHVISAKKKSSYFIRECTANKLRDASDSVLSTQDNEHTMDHNKTATFRNNKIN